MKTIHAALKVMDQTQGLDFLKIYEIRESVKTDDLFVTKRALLAKDFFDDDRIAVVHDRRREKVYSLWERN
jgi:hypothetical protein